MKKIIGVLAAVGVALALVGCDTVTPTGGSLDLVGSWAAKTVSTSTLSTTPAANGKEGTWEYKTVTYPSVETTNTITTGGTTTTTITRSDNTTTTTTVKTVVTADGSYVETTTVVKDVGARTAITTIPANTTYNNNTTVAASTSTYTQVKTVTVTVEGSNYKETTTIANTYDYVSGSTTYHTAETDSTSGTMYVQKATDLSFNNISDTNRTININFVDPLATDKTIVVTMTQTVIGTTLPAASGCDTTTTNEYTLVLNKDGTYTYTVVNTVDQAAKAAVAATATTSAVAAVAAGTQTTTTVTSGNYSNLVSTDGQVTSAVVYTALYLSQTGKKVTKVGTGSLITSNYPATAVDKTTTDALVDTWDIKVIKGAGTGAVSTMVKFSSAGALAADLLFTMAASK